MEEKTKHLEFVQNVITRLNANSFQIKGWMITIVTALLALYASSTNVVYVFIAILPIIVFWILDAYYLKQEISYRKLYQDIVDGNCTKTFNMDTHSYKMCYCKVFWSKTIAGLYCTLLISLLLLGIFLLVKDCITL